MRVVLVAVGSHGDVVPFLALARRLVDAGHEAVLVSHATLLPTAAAGVELVGVDSDPVALLDGPAARALRRADLRGLNRARGLFAGFVSAVVEPTARALDGADVLVASTFAAPAVPVARAAGVPVVRAHLWPEPDGLDGPAPVVPLSWWLPAPARRLVRRAQRAVEPLLAGFDGWWERGRLHVVPHHAAGFTTSDLGALHAYSSTIAPGPRGATTGWWAPSRPAALSPGTAALLDAPGPPWVLVGFGSMPQRSPGAVLQAVDDACRRTDTRAVLQLRGVRTGPATSRVHVVGPEPHDALLPRVAAAVHHGGAGTTGAAVRAGIPSVVVPHVADQLYWAHRLHAVGVAPQALPRPLLTGRRLAHRLEAALAPDVAARAAALGARVREEDGTGAAVRVLERLVRQHGQPATCADAAPPAG